MAVQFTLSCHYSNPTDRLLDDLQDFQIKTRFSVSDCKMFWLTVAWGGWAYVNCYATALTRENFSRAVGNVWGESVGNPAPLKILADKLTLFQPGGAGGQIMSITLLHSPSSF